MKTFQSLAVVLAALPSAFAQGSALASAASSLLASAASSAAGAASSAASRASTSTSASGSAAPAIQTVAVGQNGLNFTPDSVTASVGSQIRFVFYPKNHSVAQGNFNNPCNPSQAGIYSGFIPVSNGTANQTFTVTINNTDPIWLYCSQNLPARHCQLGMVMVINPPSSGDTLAAYRAASAAKNESAASPNAPSGGNLTSSNSTTGSGGSPSASGSARPSSTGGAMPTIVNIGVIGGLAAAVAGLML